MKRVVQLPCAFLWLSVSGQRWGSEVEASWADSSQLREGSVLGFWRPEKIPKPVVKTDSWEGVR